MIIIQEVDNVWHDSDKEMPRASTEVEFMDRNGNIRAGRIVIDLSGFFACTHDDNKWGNFGELVKWRFNPSK